MLHIKKQFLPYLGMVNKWKSVTTTLDCNVRVIWKNKSISFVPLCNVILLICEVRQSVNHTTISITSTTSLFNKNKIEWAKKMYRYSTWYRWYRFGLILCVLCKCFASGELNELKISRSSWGNKVGQLAFRNLIFWQFLQQ